MLVRALTVHRVLVDGLSRSSQVKLYLPQRLWKVSDLNTKQRATNQFVQLAR